METAAMLKRLGFAEYEARAYMALLQRNPLNGYELAKHSGIPRADIYSTLQKLEERGAVLRVEDESGSRYSPVRPDEVIGRLEASFRDTAKKARASLEQVGQPMDPVQVWNVTGRNPLVAHARALIDGAARGLLVMTGPDESSEISAEVERALERGVEVTTLCGRACPAECGHCHGHVHRHRVAPEESERWLIVVRDDQEAVAGIIGSGDEAAGIRSTLRLVVEMAAWQVRHGIAVAAILGDAGHQLEEILRPETLRVLGEVGPRGSIGWLDYMRELAGIGNN